MTYPSRTSSGPMNIRCGILVSVMACAAVTSPVSIFQCEAFIHHATHRTQFARRKKSVDERELDAML
jgi:hypothetical protein